MSETKILGGIRLGNANTDKIIANWYNQQTKKSDAMRDTLLVGIQLKQHFPTLFRLVIESSEQGKELDHELIEQLLAVDKLFNTKATSTGNPGKIPEKSSLPKQTPSALKAEVKPEITTTEPVTEPTHALPGAAVQAAKPSTQQPAKAIPLTLQGLGR